jgi:aspartate-semialdehyde dehydrogenase
VDNITSDISNKTVKLGVVGATGQVGRMILDILQQRDFPLSELRLFSSPKSAGTEIEFSNSHYSSVIEVEDLTNQTTDTLTNIDIAIFSAGGSVSLEYAPIFEQAGAIVIDNSSAWRRNPDIPLIVSEVNFSSIEQSKRRIIANPNCTTMAAMPVLKPLHDAKQLVRLSVATYQAVSGAGVAGVQELADQVQSAVRQGAQQLATNGEAIQFPEPTKFARPIAFNAVPYAGNLVDDGSLETDEEQKLRHETRRILNVPNLPVSGTCVRIPVFTGHSLVVTAQFASEVEVDEVVTILQNAPGVEVVGSAKTEQVADDLANISLIPPLRGADVAGVPTPLDAAGKDASLVGRIRNDFSLDNPKHGVVLFICNDNLRKGAALNTIQIAENLLQLQNRIGGNDDR